jgi:hypothetical protein
MSKLVMEDFSGIAAGCKIICGSDDFTKGMMNPAPLKYREPKFTTQLKICLCWVNCVIMPGVTILRVPYWCWFSSNKINRTMDGLCTPASIC